MGLLRLVNHRYGHGGGVTHVSLHRQPARFEYQLFRARWAAGLLSFTVFVFHLVLTHGFIETSIWSNPSSRFYALLGPVAVSLFFMITGFLF